MIVNYSKNNYMITSDKSKIQIDVVCDFLSKSYWAANRKKEAITKSIENSLSFALFEGNKQIGFARLITDFTTFGYLCDVYIDENYRGIGIGHWFMDSILSNSSLSNVKKFLLITKDAHEFYRKHGFTELLNIDKYMNMINQ